MSRTFDASSTQVINAIAPALSTRLPAATITNLADIGDQILSRADLTNEFLNVLVNRICRVVLTSRLWENPLSAFKKGTERYGDIIEEIFVNIANAHEYDPQIAEGEVYKREIPNVGSVFHMQNSNLFYKVTIQEEQLRKAFTSEGGMRALIAGIVDSLYAGANYDEYLSMINIVGEAASDLSYIKTATPSASTADQIVTNIRSMSNLLEFMSDNYNSVGVKNFTPKSKQILLIRADVEAILDVNALASAFNLSYKEFVGRRITVDSFGTTMENVYALLCDEEFFQVVNKLDKFTEQYNAQGLYWNYFWHVWRIYSRSPFANAVAFTTANLVAATGIDIDQNTQSLPLGGNLQLTATVAPATATNKSYRWSLSGANGGTYISATGFLHIGSAQTGTLTITCTANGGTSITDTATWAGGTYTHT